MVGAPSARRGRAPSLFLAKKYAALCKSSYRQIWRLAGARDASPAHAATAQAFNQVLFVYLAFVRFLITQSRRIISKHDNVAVGIKLNPQSRRDLLKNEVGYFSFVFRRGGVCAAISGSEPAADKQNDSGVPPASYRRGSLKNVKSDRDKRARRRAGRRSDVLPSILKL
ncbi:hypothetical protein EVAR_36140_1 [Eumeta japonica]|uniref:Uncharacterized protein n=1 Tax=Eumeta variegata TaxID=151549 RepID=A0A4C1X166_EUMVA|nr:hypothetical protein EVAR_36140_1 [Eumeta japonica]